MELYEEVEKRKKSKLTIIIGICIAVLVVITIAIIVGIMYLKNSMMKITIDGQKNNEIEKIIYIKEDNEKKLYIPIRKIAKYLNYEDYNGDYKMKSEDTTKCYVKNEYEVAMFSKDSDVLVKTREDTEYEYINLKEKVFEENGTLYTTPEGAEKAFNILLNYDLEKNRINIYTMDYLNNYYATQLKIDGETKKLSEVFADRQAIFDDMMIINTNDQYGVVNVNTGEDLLESKYEDIKYLPSTSDFLVKSNGKYGVLGKDSTVKLRIVYEQIKIIDNKNGLYLVKQNNLYGILNTKGKVIIEPSYKQIGVDKGKYEQNGVDNQYILLDDIIPVKNDQDLWGIFNIKGEKIKDFEYTNIGCSTAKETNSYPAVVIPSYKVIIVEKDKFYNLITSNGEELIPSYILDSVYMQSNTATGENKFYMTVNSKTMNIEEWLAMKLAK